MVPDFQSIMLPLLRLFDDGEDHRVLDLVPLLADEFGLSDSERQQLRPAGRQTIFENRVQWAKWYLVKAGLLATSSRGLARITDRGTGVLRHPPPRLDIKYLMRFDEFQALRSGKGRIQPEPVLAVETPEEEMERLWQTMRDRTSEELLVLVKAVPPAFFERIVIDVLVAMGYGGSVDDARGSVVGRPGDGGVDGIIKEDPLGLDAIYVQAKRWGEKVGRPEIQRFAGSLEAMRARKGVFITTSSFTPDALAFVGQIEKKIVLINGEELAVLMLNNGVGVATARTYSVERIDADYFDAE